jgi:hypothetical protein
MQRGSKLSRTRLRIWLFGFRDVRSALGGTKMADKVSRSDTADTLVAPSRPRRTVPKSTIADLRALALARGFKVERAMTGDDRWQILDKRGRAPTDPKAKSRVFSVDEGLDYLNSLGGIARYPIWRKS